jgi:hypothetical protein
LLTLVLAAELLVLVEVAALEEPDEAEADVAPQPINHEDRPAAAAEEAAATAEPSIALPISEPDAAASGTCDSERREPVALCALAKAAAVVVLLEPSDAVEARGAWSVSESAPLLWQLLAVEPTQYF